MILPVDKGRATVVMDKTEYEEKVNTMLNDVHKIGRASCRERV